MPLLLWNRTRARAEEAATANARVAESADEVFERCALVLVMVLVARDFARPINDLSGLAKDLSVLAAEFRDAGLARGAELSAPLRRVVALAAEDGRGAEDMCALVDLLQRGSARAERRGDAGDVVAGTVEIRQGRARSVRAREVSVWQGGAGRVSVTQGGIGMALSHHATTLQHAGAGIVVTRVAEISDSTVGFLVAREVNPRNVRVLFGVREAIAFGAAAGVALALMLGWRHRD